MADADASPEEVQLLAELEAGLLDGPDREHAESLAATERGRTALAALARVQADLDALPAPELPDAFWARLPMEPDQPAGPVSAARRAQARSRRSRATPWLVGAAAASLALVTTVGTGVLRGGQTSGSQAVSAGGGVASDTGSGGAGSDRTGGAGGAAESAGTGAPGDGPAAAPRDEAFALAGAPVPTVASGRDYGRDDLPQAVVALADRAGSVTSGDSAGGAAASARGMPPGGAPVELARLGEPAALRACLDALGAGLAEPLVVDFARFEGSPALVVLAASPDAGTTAYVLGPSCSATDPALRHVVPS